MNLCMVQDGKGTCDWDEMRFADDGVCTDE